MTERDKLRDTKEEGAGTGVGVGFVSASHAILFESSEACCSVCSQLLAADDDEELLSDDDASSYPPPVSGRGLLIWARGEERRYEEPQLCPACASAIGVTALHRWEIEEDEG